MSDIETHVGKLIKLRKFKSIEDFETYITESHNIDVQYNKCEENDYIKYYDDKYSLKFIFFTLDNIFLVDDSYIDYEGEIDYFEKTDEMDYNYVFQFYNGGISFSDFSEMLDEHLNQISKSINIKN